MCIRQWTGTTPIRFLKLWKKSGQTSFSMRSTKVFFTKDFKFKEPSKENEQNASERYAAKYPKTMLRPFEFDGRNEYRREKGIKQSEIPTMRLLDSLYSSGKLDEKQRVIVSEYRRLTEQLNSFGYLAATDFNNKKQTAFQGFANITSIMK